MVAANTVSNNPNPKSKNAYHIGGIQVEFPYQPYGPQLAFMGRVISTLDRAVRDGHCHALLESPTGTGKSLSLLCSTLAWQQNYKSKQQLADLTQSKPNPEAITDPIGHGGGFIPETQPSSIPPSGNLEAAQPAAVSKTQKKKAAPTIFYSSRTHGQITQVIREYRKTAYRVPMAVLASRRHYCTNAHVNGKENIDEECKLLLKDPDAGCLQFKNAHKVKGHPSLQRGGCHEVHDIEDLVKVGKVVRGCSYYAARSMADDAQLVFCPYNYVINPVIRGAMEIDIRGAILILDEAHNIEDIARDAGSVDVEEDILYKLQTELEQLCVHNTSIYQPLYEMTQDLLSWIDQRKSTLQKHGFQHYFSSWSGDKALRELQEANISQQCFPILLDCALKAIKAATDTEPDIAHLSGMAVIVLEGLFSSLTYFFSRNGCHVSDYQLALQRHIKRDRKSPVGEWTLTLSLWCLNPAVVFRDIADLSLSVILTSGTLSPMNSFSSELGVQFGTCLEAPHVIDNESQVWAAVISTGPDNYPLNASYKTADEFAFQDALGKTLEEICMIVPAGSLVFFPSYKLMEKLCNRWRETGQWSRLNAKKSLFVEPRGSQEEEFDSVLKGYYDSICKCNTHAVGRKKRVKRLDLKKAVESTENLGKGAAFLAVCRGKVSEGMDFSDDNARVVIVVGIPFPNILDIQVRLKKSYNDTYKTSKNLLSGNEWYCYQAFRALNQAIGRCIRHRFDYGAIILLDERYKKEQNRMYISKWLRKSICQYDSYSMSIEGLKSFFRDVKENIGKKMVDQLPNSETEGQKISPREPANGFTRKKNQKLNKSDNCAGKLVSSMKCNAISHLKSQDYIEQSYMQIDQDIDSRREITDVERDFPKESRFLEESSQEDPEMTLVKETPGMGFNGTTASSGSFSKDGNSSLTMIQASVEHTDQESSYSVSLTNASKDPGKACCSLAVTPKKDFNANTCSLIPEAESTLNLSVNSHTQKKRQPIGLPFINLVEGPDSPDMESPGCFRSTTDTMASKDANRRIEFDLATDSAEHQSMESKAPRVLPTNNCAPSSINSDPVMDQKLQISCSLCKSPLGLPENQLYVRCSLTSTSKIHLTSLGKERFEYCSNNTKSVPVLMADIASVDQRLYNITLKDNPGRGVWCEEDGCVFNSIYCPFCSSSNCLGVQIMATDASNVQLLNKILFYFDGLEIQNLEASTDRASKQKEVHSPSMDKTAAFNSIDRFSYSPHQNSGGWRTTRPKV
ncbi:brca1 interacting protein helicase 1 brip1, putative [Ricinus communis]|uniref:DNA 5'-3' helicase FANCJ n=1 Tax=Ricinus communis TaxID=3988 RepID=B9R8Q0_RICCO|nr:brca1 interacting protein helicase 1 brip1, putative [Ricinus communis]